MSKYDEVNGGFKYEDQADEPEWRDGSPEAILRETRLGLERSHGVHAAAAQQLDRPADNPNARGMQSEGIWKCKARSGNMGANDPQECDWPVCGCDPYANKVIEALQESGKL